VCSLGLSAFCYCFSVFLNYLQSHFSLLDSFFTTLSSLQGTVRFDNLLLLKPRFVIAIKATTASKESLWWPTMQSPPAGPVFENKACCECGESFVPTNGVQKFCTENCRTESKRNRRSQSQQAITRVESAVTPSISRPSGGTKRNSQNISPHEERENKRDRCDSEGLDDVTIDELKKYTKSQLIAEITRLRQSATDSWHMIGELRHENTEAQGILAVAEKNCLDLKKELHDAKLAFADAFIRKSSRQTFADVVRSPQKEMGERTTATLVAFLDTTEANLAPSREAVDDLLGSREDGPVAQNVVSRGDRVFISFNDEQAMVKAKEILGKKPAAQTMFKTVQVHQLLYPAIMRNVPADLVVDQPALVSEIEATKGNEGIRNAIKSAPVIFSNDSVGHVKLLFRSREARDAALKRGRIFLQSGESCSVSQVDPHREVRRCFKCQHYGHKAAVCRMKTDRCGKCAGEHQTRLCPGAPPRCVNCGDSHHSGSRSCPVQIEEARRFAQTFC
jgi:hypothetical protein